MNIGDKVIFWKDTRPLLDQHGYPAEVTGKSEDGKTVSVTVRPPHTGRSFNVIDATVSERAAPGVVTAEGVTAASQHHEGEPAAEPPPAQSPAPATAPTAPSPVAEAGSGRSRVARGDTPES